MKQVQSFVIRHTSVLKVIENFKTTLSLSCPELNVNDFFLTYWKLQHTVQEERVQPVLNGRRAEGTCTPSTSMQPPVSGDSEMLVHVPPTPKIRASHVSNSSIFFCLYLLLLVSKQSICLPLVQR